MRFVPYVLGAQLQCALCFRDAVHIQLMLLLWCVPEPFVPLKQNFADIKAENAFLQALDAAGLEHELVRCLAGLAGLAGLAPAFICLFVHLFVLVCVSASVGKIRTVAAS